MNREHVLKQQQAKRAKLEKNAAALVSAGHSSSKKTKTPKEWGHYNIQFKIQEKI